MLIFNELVRAMRTNKRFFLKFYTSENHEPHGFFAEFISSDKVKIIGTIQRAFQHNLNTKIVDFICNIDSVAQTIDNRIKLTLHLFDFERNEIGNLTIVIDKSSIINQIYIKTVNTRRKKECNANVLY